ncbi:MAG: 4Fe-4S dicluster domain-containing protein [Defluviitaleaceae bacterium]|nr:4Fe-4S dicluster domain-containing protein [Defluviitaleaceae bacterium]
MLAIKKENLTKFFDFLMQSGHDVYAPICDGELVNFERFTDANVDGLDLETLKTVRSPKDFFFPQVENLFDATQEGKAIQIEAAPVVDKPFVIFGIRPCDIKAIHILDSVYLADPVDKFYQARREQGVLISLACANPQPTCFCKAFGIDAASPEADIAAWQIGDTIHLQAQSEKGAELLKKVCPNHLIEEVGNDGEADIKAQQKEIREKIDTLPYSNGLPLEKLVPNHLLELFDAPQWDDLHKTCIACGTCTFICPTCQCYDIKDFTAGAKIKRFRCWDSCMYSDFTQMAHGNPRQTQKERFRQRFMHKLVYFPDKNNGEFACVGCGRCVAKCPSSLNIIKVIKSFGVDSNV